HPGTERLVHRVAARPHVPSLPRSRRERAVLDRIRCGWAGDEDGLDEDRAREALRPLRRGRRDRRRALRVAARADGGEVERLEETQETGADLLPAVARAGLVALAVAAVVVREDAVRPDEPARVGLPHPRVEPGRVQEHERRPVTPEVEVVETDISD